MDAVNIGAVKKPEDVYHHGDLRNSLVEEAVRLIEREGVDAFSLREVARRVGVSANAAYRHFADKDALLAAVAAHGLAMLSRRMRLATDAVTTRAPIPRAIQRFKATGRAYVHFALAHPALFRVTFGTKAGPPAPQPKPVDGVPDPYDLLSACLDALVEVGALPASRREGAELKAWVAVHGHASLALGGGPLAEPGPLESVLDFIVDGIGASAPRTMRAR